MTQTMTPTTSPHTTRDVGRLLDETEVLLATAIKDGAARVAAAMQGAPQDDGALAFVERMRDRLNDAQIEYAARTPEQLRADVRFICDTLLLFRVCPREACRRTRHCRGRPAHCLARNAVPQPAQDYAATRLLRTLMPWMPLRGSDAQRMAFECWIAGMEAGAGR